MSRQIPAFALAISVFAAPVTAQQAAMTPQQIAQVKKEVTDAVHTYYRLFTEHNMTGLGTEVYHTPWMQLGANGIETDQTPAEVTKRFDTSQLRSEFGYVFDHATPIGELVTASPTIYRVEAEFHGKSGGVRPQPGRRHCQRHVQALPQGRRRDVRERHHIPVWKSKGRLENHFLRRPRHEQARHLQRLT